MRSRYSAYALGRADYLLNTWHPRTRPARIDPDPERRWLGLTIRHAHCGGERDDRGTVEFIARFRIGGKAYRLHETSRFERIDGRWYYVDGDIRR
jgi:SEC-C motif-containing protein